MDVYFYVSWNKFTITKVRHQQICGYMYVYNPLHWGSSIIPIIIHHYPSSTKTDLSLKMIEYVLDYNKIQVSSYRDFQGLNNFNINSLWPRDVIWRQGSRSALAQVMAWCLTAPSHHLNQCWLIISEVLWHSRDSNFTKNNSDIYCWNEFNLLIWDCSQIPQEPLS